MSAKAQKGGKQRKVVMRQRREPGLDGDEQPPLAGDEPMTDASGDSGDGDESTDAEEVKNEHQA